MRKGSIEPLRVEMHPTLCNLEVEMFKISGWHTFLNAQDLNTNDLVIRIVIESNARLHLGGLDNLGIIKPKVQRVGIRIILHLHSVPYRLTTSINSS